MSSSNYTRISAIPETVYGVTPATGPFQQVRFTSESLSGTPGTTESAQLRTDRMSSGQIVTSLAVGGQINFELAKEASIDSFLAAAMLNDWETFATQTIQLTIDPVAKTITRSAGSWILDGYTPGQYATLAGFTATQNNVNIMFSAITSATVASYIGPDGMVAGTGTTTTIDRADRLKIGTTKKSFSVEKTFLDLTTKAIAYTGMVVNQFELNVAYGELITGNFGFAGNGLNYVSTQSALPTNGRTITAPATTNTFNGSIDMPFLATSASGTFDSSGLALQSVSLTLNNNYQAENVIGEIAPIDQSPGTAQIQISLNAYLRDEVWSLLGRKLTQTPFGLGFSVQNDGGFYGFYINSCQVSFEDPSAGGNNQQIQLDMSGVGKVGPNGESALVIYRG